MRICLMQDKRVVLFIMDNACFFEKCCLHSCAVKEIFYDISAGNNANEGI